MAPKLKPTHTAVTVSLSLDDKERLLVQAQRENRSLRQMARILILQALQQSASGSAQQHSHSSASH